MLSRKFDVSLSFCGEDRSAAYELADRLTKRGLTIFFDEWFGLGATARGYNLPSQDKDLTASVFVPLISKSYLIGPDDIPAVGSQTASLAPDEKERVLPVCLDESSSAKNRGADVFPRYHGENADEIAALIENFIKESVEHTRPPVDPDAQVKNEYHVLTQFSPTKPSKPVEISRFEIVHLMKELAKVPLSGFRVRIAMELVKYISVEHDVSLGWPYDIWHHNGSIFLSVLPNFSLPHQTYEFVVSEKGATVRLRSVWITQDERYRKIDYHLWQPSVAKLTADRVVPCLEREVAIRILEQLGVDFGFPLTSGEKNPKKLCGWIQQLPQYECMEWGRDPRLVAGCLGPMHYTWHEPSGIAILTLMLFGRWSAMALRALNEALEINLPSRHRVTVLGQGRIRIAVFLADTAKRDRGRAFLAQRRMFAAVARMYAALRELPVPPPDGSVALPHIDEEIKTRFDFVCDSVFKGGEIEVVGAYEPNFDVAPVKRLSETAVGRSLGFSQEPDLDLDTLITHRDIVQFVQRHE